PRVRPGPEPGRGRLGVGQVRAAGQPGGPRQGRAVGPGGGRIGRSQVPARPAPGVHPSDRVAGRLTRRLTLAHPTYPEFGHRGQTQMHTPGVAEAAMLLRDFHFVGPSWDGAAFVPFWGRELDVSIDPDEDGITPRQLAVLRAVLNHKQDLRPEFERALFAYYQADVDGTYCSYDEHARPIPGTGPAKLTEAAQVWGLIDDP